MVGCGGGGGGGITDRPAGQRLLMDGRGGGRAGGVGDGAGVGGKGGGRGNMAAAHQPPSDV